MRRYTSWNALSYLDINAGKLIRGVRILTKEGKQVGRFAIFRDKDGAPLVYYLHAAGENEVQLFSYDSSIENDVLNQLQEAVDFNVNLGLQFEEINPEEEFLEVNE